MKSGVRIPTVEELAIINQHFAKKELKAEDVYVFDLMAANNKTVTAYFSKLGNDMIEAFQENAMRRQADPNAPIVGFMFGHNDEMIPSGTIFSSKLDVKEPTVEGGMKEMTFRPSVFMSKNLNVGGINTDDYVKAYEAGHTEDVSVGFIAGSYLCDICNNDVRSWSCNHVPGRVYNLSEDPEKPLMKQATYTVHQGVMKKLNLAEISGVYRGALWGAKVESQLSVDGKNKEGKNVPMPVMSRNIKDFKEGDVLRFNCAGDGVIELVERPQEDQSGKDPAAELNAAQKKIILVTGENGFLKTESTKLQAKITELDGSLKAVSKTLSLSEVEKVDLKDQLDAAVEASRTLEAENKVLTAANEKFMAELKARCEKLSIQVNGQNHKAELFVKEIAALSADEIRAKIIGLETQLAALFPPGRKSQGSESVLSGGQSREIGSNPNLFKIG